jgi:ribosome production factor 2
MIMKGRKSNKTMNDLMADLQMMKGRARVQMLVRNCHDMIAMDDPSLLENQSVKYDASLFAVGSHQKKRPDNLVLGRVFDGHILDMFELGIVDFRSTAEFEAPKYIDTDMKPILIFQGEQFESSDKHKRMKSLLIDFFHQRHLKEANIQELKRVMIFTSRGENDPIEFRHLECDNINESTV